MSRQLNPKKIWKFAKLYYSTFKKFFIASKKIEVLKVVVNPTKSRQKIIFFRELIQEDFKKFHLRSPFFFLCEIEI